MNYCLIDMKNRKINVFSEKGIDTFGIDNVSAFERKYKNSKIIYITKATETNVSNIAELLLKLSQQMGIKQIADPLVLHPTQNICIRIPDRDLTLKSIRDFIPINDTNKDLLEDRLVKIFLARKDLEIIPFSEMKKVIALENQKQRDVSVRVSQSPISTNGNDIPIAESMDITEDVVNYNPSRAAVMNNESSLLPEDS